MSTADKWFVFWVANMVIADIRGHLAAEIFFAVAAFFAAIAFRESELK